MRGTSPILYLGVSLLLSARLDSLERMVVDQPENLKLGSEYRQEAIRESAFDRSIALFERLAKARPQAANVYVNLGFAYVDKIPTVGFFTQVRLGNKALDAFTKSLTIRPSWIAYYTRAEVALYWPKQFGKARGAVEDLQRALDLQRGRPLRPYYVRTYIALGDANWKLDNLDRAREVWAEGLRLFPGNVELQTRLAKRGRDLTRYLNAAFDRNRRSDTDLSALEE